MVEAGLMFEDNLDDHLEQNLQADVVQEVLKTGTDLRQYSKQIERKLKDAENKSIQDYIKESQNIASLHNQISACDNILERMESMLLSFQSDLGSISSEILFLQRKSVAMSQQLHNRQAVRAPLSQFIDEMAVSETLIKGILDSPVTEEDFLTQLTVLNHKINFVKEQSIKDVKSCQDVKEVLEKLKIKAVTKIRAYLLEQVYKFRKPMTNYQIPQNAMLKHKFYYEFLLSNERTVAQEVRSEYVDTMSKIYYSYFKSYSSRIMKLQYDECATKDDLMGIEDTGPKGLFYKTSLKNKGTVFTIGNRGDVLTSHLEAPIIVPHAAQKNENKYPFEALFRSEQYCLVDNACREYLFLTEFFMVKGSHALDLFDQIMAKTLNLLVKNLETFVQSCYDAIALFLCAHLILRYQIMCHKRAVPALDQYWEALQSAIWPRFEYIFRLNINSVQDCDPMKFSAKEMGPHYITRRYAEFSAAIVGLSETYPSELVNRLLAELQEQVECFILRMAAIFPQRKEQLIFLINNYDMVLQVLMERTKDNSKEAETFREQLNTRSAEYVEEILSPHFGGIIQFVKEGEVLLEKGQAEDLKKQESKSLVLVQSFSNNWKRSLEELSQEVLTSFPSFVTGSSLLQLALTQLVQYYHRFHKLLTPNARSQLTNIHHIMVEIKKYKTNF
ncbi:vacuolar protein sorting-associated protein 52 homolog [Schistocerca americana]|uniref:vacuolar protein sorting-associated protein 52 homolog n=1 Tax=Schistocerca americana TaxID=7009 RepID=UPI001F4FF93F|nr:vacuolar protein sorting-associated protein 52 homolog [Schistocerca americana]XP_047117471.1 vacuolar protein sorting-associated protein 52 homolog [Schistocerca piceifrons]XP_049814929.1 vacuolar protein sorting-associated protein 52 homolog [Schistocerca nitens]XP_049814930.1 vacuolar protein sorting-associated protein 52 homolog [Schistocerca nitens]